MADEKREISTLLDPLQGFDIKVTTSTYAIGAEAAKLVGAFTSLMFKVVNQTETYLPLNSRIPRHLDGEIIVVWSLEQGLVEINIVSNTFGTDFATGFFGGRGTLIPRSERFDVHFLANMASVDQAINNEATFVSNVTTEGVTGGAGGREKEQYTLKYCRVDTFSFGVTAGRHIVANAWQGTAQHITNEAAETAR